MCGGALWGICRRKARIRKGGRLGMVILGIDPGLATLGYGVISKDENGKCQVIDYGVVTTPKEESLPTRLVLLEDGINQILKNTTPTR